jgi:putative membrane protein
MFSAGLGLLAERYVLHGAIMPGTPWWQVWHFDAHVVVPLGFMTFFYLLGLRRWTERSREHPWWRTALYLSGMALLILSLQSPIDALGMHHFTFHMLQHEIMMMIAIPMILLGAPTTPTLRGLPPIARQHVIRPMMKSPLARGLYRLITHPVVAIGVFVFVLWAWHYVPGWYDAVLEGGAIHDLQHLTMAGAAALFWWNVIDPRPLRSRVPLPARILYIFAAGIPKMAIAAFITFADEVIYPTYLEVWPIVGLDPLEDQQLGGLIMWVPSKFLMLIIAAIIFFVWANRDSRARDAQRAAEEALRADAAARPSAG